MFPLKKKKMIDNEEEPIGSVDDMKSEAPVVGEEDSNEESTDYEAMLANCSKEELESVIEIAQAKLKEMDTVGSSETET